MSTYVDTCDEQYLSIEQLLRLLIQVDSDGNLYLNTTDSGFNPDDLIQFDCDEQYPIKSILKQAIIDDDACLLEIDFHIQIDQAGSKSEYVK